MKKTVYTKVVWVLVIFPAFILMGSHNSEAMKKHHQSSATPKASALTESVGPGAMKQSKSGGMGMKGRRGGPDGNGESMMGGMEKNMMRMMMSHMMGGPGGMRKMMDKMKSGTERNAGGLRSMVHMARMLEELDLTPEQWDQVRQLARTGLDKMVDLWAQRMKLRIELASVNWEEKVDAQKVKELFVKRAEAKADMLMACLTYLRSLQELLTPEQLEQLNDRGS